MQATPASPSREINSFSDIPPPVTNEDLIKLVFSGLMDRRQPVEIGENQFRFQRGGEVFEHDGKRMLALTPGIYAYLPTASGGHAINTRWIHLGPPDEMKNQIKPFLPRTPSERLELYTKWKHEEDLIYQGKSGSGAPGAAAQAPADDASKSEGARPSVQRRPTPFDQA